jgi:hypothetical protein
MEAEYLGEVRVLGSDTQYIRGLITDALQEIYRGDRITTRQDIFVMREPSANTVGLDASLIGLFKDVNLVGEHDYILVDRGINHGVKVGNRFVALVRGDGNYPVPEAEISRYPYENVGELLILFVDNNHSVGIVTRSNVELGVGAYLRMIKGY